MNTLFGIAVDAWVTIDRECEMDFEVVGGQAQLTLGHRAGSLQLVMDEPGLTKLVDVARRTLDEMRVPSPSDEQPTAANP